MCAWTYTNNIDVCANADIFHALYETQIVHKLMYFQVKAFEIIIVHTVHVFNRECDMLNIYHVHHHILSLHLINQTEYQKFSF